MDLSKILSISGKAGLFTVVSQLKNAVLVESLLDKKRFPAFAHEKISSLQEISIFTTGEDKPLKEILKTMHEKLEGKPALEGKTDNASMVALFKEMVPDFDQERVYASDIKKIVNWYNLLLENNLLDFTETEEDENAEAKAEEGAEITGEVKDAGDKKKKATVRKADNVAKQVKPASAKGVKKSEHRSMNSK
jgi:hypothetical protein